MPRSGITAPLHLDEAEDSALFPDDVDFTDGSTEIALEDRVALPAEGPSGEIFASGARFPAGVLLPLFRRPAQSRESLAKEFDRRAIHDPDYLPPPTAGDAVRPAKLPAL